MADTKLPSIGQVPPGTDPQLRTFLDRMREALEVRLGRRGDPLDKAVTFRDFDYAGGTVNGLTIPGRGGSGGAPAPIAGVGGVDPSLIDYEVPPDPQSLVATGGFATNFITFSIPEPYKSSGRHAFAEIRGADRAPGDPAPVFSSAVLIGSTDAQIYSDALGATGKTRHYWVRFVKITNDAAQPYVYSGWVGGLNGVAATSALVGGADIQPLTITNALIAADAAIDQAKIGALSASKITAGDIDAARMQANIVTALVGKYTTLSALTASLGTVTINSSGWLVTNGVTGYGSGTSGVFMGYEGGAYKFRVGDVGANYLGWDGTNITVYSPKFVLFGGSATFSGYLNAANGVFTGTVQAGAVVSGVVRNGSYTNYLDLNASGGSIFLNAANKAVIYADGSTKFNNLVASGVRTGLSVEVYNSGAPEWIELAEINTGYSLPGVYAATESYSAMVNVTHATIVPVVAGGTEVGVFSTAAEVFFKVRHWVLPHSNNSTVEVWLRVRAKFEKTYSGYVSTLSANEVTWAIYKIT